MRPYGSVDILTSPMLKLITIARSAIDILSTLNNNIKRSAMLNFLRAILVTYQAESMVTCILMYISVQRSTFNINGYGTSSYLWFHEHHVLVKFRGTSLCACIHAPQSTELAQGTKAPVTLCRYLALRLMPRVMRCLLK